MIRYGTFELADGRRYELRGGTEGQQAEVHRFALDGDTFKIGTILAVDTNPRLQLEALRWMSPEDKAAVEQNAGNCYRAWKDNT